jgi:tetratricopeptide (TPR) repeat protein
VEDPVQAHVKLFLGGLEAMRGRFAEARSLVEGAETAYSELGLGTGSATDIATVRSAVEMLAGEYATAERALTDACESLEGIHRIGALATRSAELAEALYAQGRYEDAEVAARVAEERGPPDDLPTQFLWRTVTAKLLARRGAFAEGQRLGREAFALAERTDSLNQRAQVALDCAEVHYLAGRVSEAAQFLGEAAQLYERKGNLVGLRRARKASEGYRARGKRKPVRQGSRSS